MKKTTLSILLVCLLLSLTIISVFQIQGVQAATFGGTDSSTQWYFNGIIWAISGNYYAFSGVATPVSSFTLSTPAYVTSLSFWESDSAGSNGISLVLQDSGGSLLGQTNTFNVPQDSSYGSGHGTFQYITADLQTPVTLSAGTYKLGVSGNGNTLLVGEDSGSKLDVYATYTTLYSITITSSPAGSGYVTVDSSSYTTPHTFTWAAGDSHTIAATSTVSGGAGIQYVYSSWSDSGTQSHSYTVPTNDATVTAYFTTQYYLTVSSSLDSPTGQGWYNSGGSATFSVSTVNGYTFNGWTGTGTGSYTGSALSYTVTMNNAITETASWTPVTPPTPTPPPAPSATPPPPGGAAVVAGQIAGGSIFDIMAQNSSASIPLLGELAGYWAFDEGSGTTAHDSSGNSNTGTLVNSPEWVTGKYGDALSFNGVNQSVSVSQSASLTPGTQTWSIFMWIKTTTTSREGLLDAESAGNNGFYFDILSTGHLRVGFQDGVGVYVYKDSSVAVNNGSWNFIGFTYSSSVIHVYVNAVDVSTGGGSSGSLGSIPEENYKFGYSIASGNYFSGVEDNILVYNNAVTQLSPTQITQLYTYSGSSYTVSTTVPNFQSFSTTVSLYQGAIWYTGGGNTNWDAPTYDFNTGYLEYGVNYVDASNATAQGWYVKISVVGGAAGTFSGDSQAYVELACAWYNAGSLTKTDYLFVAYDAYRANDTTTQFELYINLWLSNQNGNSMVGGAVTAVYYGTTQTGWGPWSSWGPVDGLLSQSTFYGPLYNSTGNVISASDLQNNIYKAGIFTVWTSIAKTGIGYGPYSDDLHVWATTCKNLEFNGLPIGATLVGINAPSILPTTTPNNPTGIFGELGNSITSALNSMNQALSTMISSASGVGSSVLNQAFSAMGVTNGASAITSYASTMGNYFNTAVSDIANVIVPIFTGIANFGLFAVTWIASFITTIINIGTYVVDLLTGVPTFPNGIGNPLSPTGPNAFTFQILGQTFTTVQALIASGALFLFIAVWWFESLDKRAKQYGGGWMSFFMSDIQNIISVLSFIFDMAWRIITTTISLGTQFLNLFL